MCAAVTLMLAARLVLVVRGGRAGHGAEPVGGSRGGVPGLAQVDGKPGRAALVLAARRLRAVEAQARVRAAVEREQADIGAMNERAYRKFARQCIRQRAETAKAVRSAWTCWSCSLWHSSTSLCVPSGALCLFSDGQGDA